MSMIGSLTEDVELKVKRFGLYVDFETRQPESVLSNQTQQP